MSAYGLHPTFTDFTGYRAWFATWRLLYADLRMRHARQPGSAEMAVMLEKTRTLLASARQRMRRIRDMHRQMADQAAGFPITIAAPSVDFHFNKGCLEFPFLPPWAIKTKGKTFYVSHVDFDCVGTTRETPEHPSTKGAMRFRNVSLVIDGSGEARITRRVVPALSAAA